MCDGGGKRGVGRGGGKPSVLIFSEVLTRANRVELKVTVPSGCSGTFISTSLCKSHTTSSSARHVRASGTGSARTHLTGDPMRTQFSKTERRLNATQHGDDVDVLHTTAARKNTSLAGDTMSKQKGRRGLLLTWLRGRSRTRLA